ncbi:MAG: DUF1285 domain-containing protein [Paraglaciecola sp.]|uniref:DUF1285 domain-containing protein n=1 Tax=Paraglaciecola sp. TaxID=1920173 RepID=UPI003298C056
MENFDLGSFQAQINSQQNAMPSLEKWNPDFCGNIDMQIKHDGSWLYMGTPIGRKALVKLFASVLKRESDEYFLVTPAEKVGIQVVDAPFIITQWHNEEGELVLTSNVGDILKVSAENPIELFNDKLTGATLPYAKVRRNLWARFHQNVFYQLAELGQEQNIKGQAHLTLNSGDYCFSLGTL